MVLLDLEAAAAQRVGGLAHQAVGRAARVGDQDVGRRLPAGLDPAFAPGTRVLLVDQWVETGGTMKGAIELVERSGLPAVVERDGA